ncbi:MAG: antirestriction protein ArdA, partial [Bacilli bacterium]|nr:antirestriction protein ArdA [Bacilli bacterium]
MSQEINIWVSNLGKYNEGILQGAWFTLPTEMSEIRKKIGLNERYEEWAIHDYEAPFKISEYDDIGTLNEIAELIEETEIPDVVWNNMSELLDYFSGS